MMRSKMDNLSKDKQEQVRRVLERVDMMAQKNTDYYMAVFLQRKDLKILAKYLKAEQNTDDYLSAMTLAGKRPEKLIKIKEGGIK